MQDDEDEDSPIRTAHEALVAGGVIEPLSRDPGETRRWLDCELSSLVAGRFFVALDPEAIGPDERAAWEPRATSGEPLSSPHGHRWYRKAYWLRDGPDRAGTIALATRYIGEGRVTVSSLYTLPSRRRRGIAGRALRRAHEAVIASGGEGLRVPAYWTWQAAVRFYLGLGMWVHDWRHAIVFTWRDASHRITIGGREARFSVVEGGAEVPLIVATRAGERLGWTELPGLEPGSDAARQTFAVALATHGFPLIRSAEAWDDRHLSSDGGHPEGLAHKIAGWEAWDRDQGWELRTPRIPGLDPLADHD